MRLFSIVVLFVFLALPAMAMDESLRNMAFEKSVLVTIDNDCTPCDIGTAVYLGNRSGDGYWLTACHVVQGLSTFYVNGASAEVVDSGMDINIVGSVPDYMDWALVRTENYAFYEDTPISYNYYFNQALFYVNENKHYTVTKMRAKTFFDDGITIATTTPQLGNSGSGVFNFEGQLVGIIIGKVIGSHNTMMLRLRPEMLAKY